MNEREYRIPRGWDLYEKLKRKKHRVIKIRKNTDAQNVQNETEWVAN